MDDLTGSHIPSDKEIAARTHDAEALATKIKPYTVALNKQQRQKAPRPREGFDKIAPNIAAAVDKYGIVLPKMTTKGMLADLQVAAQLVKLRPAIAALLQRIDDTVLEANAEAYWVGTAFYTALARAAGDDPDMERDLAAIIDFFALGPRPPKGNPEPAPEPTPTPVTGS